MTRAGSSCRRVTRPAKVTGGLTYDEGPNRNDEVWSSCSQCGYAPSGVAYERREEDSRISGNDLLEAILENSNVSRAWKRVKANKGSAGVDGISINDFPTLFGKLWPDLRKSLEQGAYTPSPVLRVEIDKPDGGKRQLGIPIVLDRLIQQSIAQIIGPLFDPWFSESSFGFRPKRSAKQAVTKISEIIQMGRRIAVDLDLSKFFDRVNHDVLMVRVARKVQDKRVLALIGKYLRAGVQVEGRLQRTKDGVPQGGPLSPLLANIVLDDLDKELERRGHHFARYADDFVILVKSQRAGDRVMTSIQRFLETKLKLKVNQEKSQVVKASQLEFLGFAFKGKRIVWSAKSLHSFNYRIHKLTSRSWGVSMKWRLKKLAQYMRGWMGYYGISHTYKVVLRLDSWIRRRLRCCYWKQWKTISNRIRNLMKLGIGRRNAILHGVSGKGCWVMSKTPVINEALSSDWLSNRGLLSLKTLWIHIHYPTTVR